MRSSYAPQHFLLNHQAAGIAIRPLVPGGPAIGNNRFAEILPCGLSDRTATRSVTAS
jgi:hypothetical protein